MDLDSEDSLFVDSGDDVIEVESTPPRALSPSTLPAFEGRRPAQVIPPDHLPGFAETFGLNSFERNSTGSENVPHLPTPIILPSPQGAAHPQRRANHHHHRRQARASQPSRTRQPTTTVIDLTEEPDSPVQAQPSQQSSQPQSQSRNPRRTTSQRISPPTLSRSERIISRSNMPDFIDLTSDSPERDMPRRIPSPHRRPIHHQVLPGDHLVHADLVRNTTSASRVIGSFRRSLAGIFNSDWMQIDMMRSEVPLMGYIHRPVVPEETPKPAMEPTPATREGFTRDTCAEPTEDMVVVCPNCNEELAYDPSGPPAQNSTPGKGTKRKRTVPEHHFWALKKCGHVYCSNCFENRRPTKSNRQGVGFPMPDEREPFDAPNEMQCAVPGCDTNIAPKGEWVGLYA